MKKIAPLLRLNDNHPTAVKLSKLFDLADKLGISLSFYNHTTIVEDRDRDRSLPPLHIKDIEDYDNGFGCFPPTTEYKIIYDNPEYLAEQQRQNEERKRKEEERLTAERLAAAAKEKSQKERQAKEKEAHDRKLLQELKEKYENAPG